MTANGVGEGVFPVVLVKVDGITTRALIDTGTGSSYASAPSEVTIKHVEMLIGSISLNWRHTMLW